MAIATCDPQGLMRLALVAGVLEIRDSCLGLGYDDGWLLVVFPRDVARVTDDGMLELHGRRVAVGEHVNLGGGFVDSDMIAGLDVPGGRRPDRVWLTG